MLPPPAKMFAAFASAIAYVMTVKSVIDAAVPPPVQQCIISFLGSRFGARLKSRSTTMAVIIEDKDRNGKRNPFYDDAMEYFGTKVRGRGGKKIRVTREPDGKSLTYSLSEDEVVSDQFQGIKIDYKFCKFEKSDPARLNGHEYIEITFEEKHRDVVLDTYLPYIENTAAEMKSRNKILMMHTNSNNHRWEKMRLIHPSTFNTMAMSVELKNTLIHDIDRFVTRKEFYKRIGKAWKRGYLLYGPPGTGKTSLVAAIANHLNFDIYDLQLTAVQEDVSLRKLLLGISNGSVLVVEDIDKSSKLQSQHENKGLSLAGVLNCIDGIWSSCGEERIIIFTTNDKNLIDPALLRPGRMDVHIYMGHCCFEGFLTLASNFFGLEQHPLFPEVERLIEGQVITPAQVAGELMKVDDGELALENLVKVLQKLKG